MGLALAVYGCNEESRPPGGGAVTPTQNGTSTPEGTAAVGEPTKGGTPAAEATRVYRIMHNCSLLNSRSVAGLFPAAEVQRPSVKVDQVDKLIFSTAGISATESSCIYYVFYKPGTKDNEMIQVTTWVDAPGEVNPDGWSQVWTEARLGADRAVEGVGDDAFYKNGRLTFKKGDLYVTLEVVGTNVDLNTSEGKNQQMDMEKRMALDAVGNM
jgi:hypothetical protein